MNLDLQHYKNFLIDQDRAELTEIQSYISRLLSNLRKHAEPQISKRPHMAMPERRTVRARYQVGLGGFCWDACREIPKSLDKIPVRILDISSSGCRLISNVVFRPLQILSLEFEMPQGRGKRILIEVVRVRKCQLPEQVQHEIGCRTLNAEIVDRARKEKEYFDSIRLTLDDHASIPILHLAAGTGSANARKWFRKEGFPVTKVGSVRDIPSLLKKIDPVAPPRLFVCPASLVAKKTPPAWLTKIDRAQPPIGVLAIAANEKEYTQSRANFLVDQTVLAKEFEIKAALAVDRAQFKGLLREDETFSHSSLKILLAGSDEKDLRRFQTLLIGEDYHIDKVLTYEAALRELEFQMFDVLVIGARLLNGDSEEKIKELQAKNSGLVIVIEADAPARTRNLISLDIDLVLEPMANRAKLLQCLERARNIFQQRTLMR